jgi:hypothetical protein
MVLSGGDGSLVADPAEVVRGVVDDLRAGVPAAEIAAVFHATVAALIPLKVENTRKTLPHGPSAK